MAGPDAPGLVVLEAPTGFGKSWLVRKAMPKTAVRLRGELGHLADADIADDTPVIIDDAHLLRADEVDRLVEVIEDAPPFARLVVSGRILDHALHDVVHLVDGLILDAAALSISAEELAEEVTDLPAEEISHLVDVSDGCVRIIASVIDQWRRGGVADLAALANQMLRVASAAATQQLSQQDRVVVNLVARAPGIDQGLLARLGGPGFARRALDAGVPLRRRIAGDIEISGSSAYQSNDFDAVIVDQFASELVSRGRPLESVGLLLDAGEHDRATRLMIQLPESVTRSVDARAMLSLLARFGTVTEKEPALLLTRAAALSVIGQLGAADADVLRAISMVDSADPALRRRIKVEEGEWLLMQGRREEAIQSAEEAILELGPGEDRTYARAHMILADALTMSDKREALQRGAEIYRVAAAAWDSCAEHAKARMCRCNLATSALVPLGRYDEALAQLAQVLSAPDLTDAERSWMMMNEGFVLYGANRLESAEARFERVADLGYVQDNPRIIAASAWGRAVIAARRQDVATTLRWIATAENTALGMEDDVLGVPFHCEMATALGGLGELDLAERHLAIARQRRSLFVDQLSLADFLIGCRRGVVGDVEAQLERTQPAEWWRVLLLAAYASATDGDLGTARKLFGQAERELVGLGHSDFESLGEGRIADQTREMLGRVSTGAAATPAYAPRTAIQTGARTSTGRPVLRVIGRSMSIDGPNGTIEVAPGNPQKLVGVVVASGGVASFDQLSEAIWPGDDVETSRSRLRNVLLRLRRSVGDVVVRTGAGVRLAPDYECDLYQFDRLAGDALAAARTDPDLAGHLAAQAMELADGSPFSDFEYEEWASRARAEMDQKLIALLDLLSVQAEDNGDLIRAQTLAERALRLDRYSDSRYVRLAEILTLQGRAAAALAVLEDAAGVAREVSGAVSPTVKMRRESLLRRTANE